jgi:uncharacterized protein YcbX
MNLSEPLQGFRRDQKGQVVFGQLLITLAEGQIKVGDSLKILA